VLVNPLLPSRDVSSIVEAAQAQLVVSESDEWKSLASAVPSLEIASTTEESAGFWLCTSGSTGRPKLAMHRHYDLKVTADTYAREILDVQPEDTFFSVGPMFHAYGLGNSVSFPMSVGARAVLEAPRPPSPKRVAEIVQAERPTLFFAIPTFYAALNASDIADDTFASVRLAVSAAESLPAETWHRFHDRFGVEILDGIGSTEMTHIFLSNRARAVRPGTTGQPVTGYDVRVVDDDGSDRDDDVPGHLWVRGESAASGYYGNADATEATFGLGDRWVRTGDTYVRDKDGFFTYLGRSDDMLRVGGEWVAPAEVEATIIEHPSVLEVAIVGAVDDRGITRPVAFVVAKDGVALTGDDVIEHCRSRLAGYKRPRRVMLVDSLPKTATGKIQRYKLRG
jgi:benzoate-CoA ligase